MMKSILSVGCSEQNMSYPPFVFSDQFNVVTGLLLNKLVKSYPENIDQLKPFMVVKPTPVKDGNVELDENYRDFLSASISAKKDKTGECEDPVIIDNEQEFKIAKLKSGCLTRPIRMVDDKQWDYRTTSTYDFPTYFNPIGCFFEKNKFKVCPYDLGTVTVRFTKMEKIVRYGYIMNPDDTFIFDKNTSVESEWDNSSFDLLFTAMMSLYGAYTRDNTITDWSRILHNEGIL